VSLIFFDFEEIFATNDISKICPAFKEFNIQLLKVFRNYGLETFKTIFLSPFGRNVPINNMIEIVEKMKI
jgi:hypothetical protein